MLRHAAHTLTVAALLLPGTAAPEEAARMNAVVEIRSYTLKPGTRDHFHELARRDAVPMLRRWKIDVVAHGPSLHDRDSYYLIRAFTSTEEREKSEDAFYGSEEWREGPRAAVLAAIESYTTVVVRVDEATLDGLRRTGSGSASAPRPADDLAAVTALNRDYVRSVAMSDAGRFEEILAPDFLCASSDGSLLDRAAFLVHVAQPTQISELQAHDVDVRLLGDVAIVHARTTFRHRDGRTGASRYTDIWARRQGRWLAVAAQVTRY